MNFPHQWPIKLLILKLKWNLCGFLGSIIWIKKKSNLINVHRLVIISCPEHMQITPDTEGYLSMSYSTVNIQKQHGCWWTWHSVMKWTHHQLLKQHTQWMEPWFTAKERRDLTAGRAGESVNCSYISALLPPQSTPTGGRRGAHEAKKLKA